MFLCFLFPLFSDPNESQQMVARTKAGSAWVFFLKIHLFFSTVAHLDAQNCSVKSLNESVGHLFNTFFEYSGVLLYRSPTFEV